MELYRIQGLTIGQADKRRFTGEVSERAPLVVTVDGRDVLVVFVDVGDKCAVNRPAETSEEQTSHGPCL